MLENALNMLEITILSTRNLGKIIFIHQTYNVKQIRFKFSVNIMLDDTFILLIIGFPENIIDTFCKLPRSSTFESK